MDVPLRRMDDSLVNIQDNLQSEWLYVSVEEKLIVASVQTRSNRLVAVS
jgi:hypothetical protein